MHGDRLLCFSQDTVTTGLGGQRSDRQEVDRAGFDRVAPFSFFLRYLVKDIVPHFAHKLFLTATPHNGYPESFTALLELLEPLELLDAQQFARGVELDQNPLQVVMVRRLKQEMQNWDGSPMFPRCKLEAIAVDYPQAERQAHAALQRYTELRTKGRWLQKWDAPQSPSFDCAPPSTNRGLSAVETRDWLSAVKARSQVYYLAARPLEVPCFSQSPRRSPPVPAHGFSGR